MTLIAEAEQNLNDRRPPVRRKRRAATLVAVPALVGLLAAAGWATLRRDATQAAAFACVGEDVTAVLPNDGTPPIDACKALWEAGQMDAGRIAAPPLAACVSDAGTIEVIIVESNSACEARGMGTWTGQDDYGAVGAAVREARVSLHDRYRATGNGCATVQDWQERLAPRLVAAGWTFEIDRVEPDRRCFGVGYLEPVKKRIVLIGVPGDFSISCDPRTGC